MENSNVKIINKKTELKFKLPKLQVLQKNKEYFKILGINLNADTDGSHTFNRTILIGFILCALNVIFNFVYIIYEANTFSEFIQSIYFCFLSVDVSIVYTILIFREQLLLEFTSNFENIINASELIIEIQIKFFEYKL